jgi:hypothetical protein
MGVSARPCRLRGAAAAILAVVLLAACDNASDAPQAVAEGASDRTSPPHAQPKTQHTESAAVPQSFKAAIRSELRVAAHRFVDLAQEHVNARLAGPLPVDTPVGLYLGNLRQRTIAAQAVGSSQQWNMCVSAYGHPCPTSPLGVIAAMRSKPVISWALPSRCLTTLADRPTGLGGSHVVVVQPAKPRSCATDFAVELWMNDVGQVTSVNLLLGR